MDLPEAAYEPVPAQAAVARLLAWRSEDRDRWVAEVAGAPGSGRSEILLRTAEALPGSVTVDATGLTAEEILARVLSAAGLPQDRLRRANWGPALAKSGLGDGPVVILNAHRAGATRRSSQPGRVVRELADGLVRQGRVKVIVETEPGERRRTDRLALLVTPENGTGTPEEDPLSAPDAAVRVLALAEPRPVPLTVWRALLRAADGPDLPERELAELARRSPRSLALDGELVRFGDERDAGRLRTAYAPDEARRIHDRLLTWLLEAAGAWEHPAGWAAAGPAGRYAAHGLAMHAVQAGRFDAVQRDGKVVAQLDQVALLDAAACHYREAALAMDTETASGDAANLWLSGVDSLGQGEWASWLHLMSTARGDHALAQDIELSGLALPWRTRWTRWRPPGGVRAGYLRPGAVQKVSLTPVPGRKAVVSEGMWDTRFHLWDARTGELLAGPWPGAVPEPGQAQPQWPVGEATGATQPWVQLTAYGNVEPAFLTAAVRFDDMVVQAGMGGLFAIEPADPSRFQEIVPIHGEPFLADFGTAVEATPQTWSTPDPDVLTTVFGAGAVRRVPEPDLPDGLRDAEARRVLAEIGLPAFTGAEMSLPPADELDWAELTLDDLWGDADEDVIPDSAGDGPYFRLGIWMGGAIVLDGEEGRVYRAPADEYDDHDPLVAAGLGTFLAMLQSYVPLRCLLTMASSRAERDELREQIETELDWVDEEGAVSSVWTSALQDE